MNFRNNGTGESNILQNQFTRYLKTAIQRKKIDLFRMRNKVYGHEYYDDCWQNIPGLIAEDLYFNSNTQLNAFGLEEVFQRIKNRDRYIFFAHVLGERTFSELSTELGMGYKSIAAAYYRVVHKTRKMLRGDGFEF